MIRVFELFSGIGTQSLTLERILGKNNVKIVGSCDFYLPAIYCFNALHGVKSTEKYKTISTNDKINYLSSKNLSMNSKATLNGKYWKNKDDSLISYAYQNVKISEEKYNNFFDITKICLDDLPECDLLTYSFPCQDISVQGKGKGFSRNMSTRSGLLWKVEEIIKEYKKNNTLPQVLVMENVSSILNKNHVSDFEKWKHSLLRMGYENTEFILNSVNCGSVQSRSRAFLISVLKNGNGNLKFDKNYFDSRKVSNKSIKHVLQKYDASHEWFKKTNYTHLIKQYKKTPFNKTSSGLIKSKILGYSTFNSEATIYHEDGKSPTLTATGANSRIKCFTKENELLSICPSAAFQLMGHTKSSFEKMYSKVKDHVSYHNLIHVAGNAISVEALSFVFKKIYEGK